MGKQHINVIDLFCGCGGFSLGFERAGFDVLLGIDVWKDALTTFEFNHRNSVTLQADLSTLAPESTVPLLKGKKVDVIIGGLPCQGFSVAGKRIVSHFIPLNPVLGDVIDEKEYSNESLFFSDRAVAGMLAVREKMNKGRAQNLDEPCNTISAHLAKVSLNSTDPVLMIGNRYRRFSTREAARIQSFPDTFHLDVVSPIRQYKAIGNAVPPVMMWHIANTLQRAFEVTDGEYDAAAPEVSPYYFYPNYDGQQGCLFEQAASYGCL